MPTPTPPGVTAATVTQDPPEGSTGVVVKARFTPSASLTWKATGTPLTAFLRTSAQSAPGEPLTLQLPHTDQPGFVDGAGNTVIDWHYSVKVWFVYPDRHQVSLPSRDFQVSSGETAVDLAEVPFVPEPAGSGGGGGGGGGLPVLHVPATTPDPVVVAAPYTEADSWWGADAFYTVVEYTPSASISGVIPHAFGPDFADPTSDCEFMIFTEDPRVDSSASTTSTDVYQGNPSPYSLTAATTYWLVWIVWSGAASEGKTIDRGPIVNLLHAKELGLVAADADILFSGHSDGSVEYLQLPPSPGVSAWAEGDQTLASGTYSHAEGYKTAASGAYGAHAEGLETTASGISAHAEGGGTRASNDSAHAEGSDSEASGNTSHAEGLRSTASGQMSHAEGYQSTASGDMSHAEGTSQATEPYESSRGMRGAETSVTPKTWSATDTGLSATAARTLTFPIRADGMNVITATVTAATGVHGGPASVWEVSAVIDGTAGTPSARFIGTPAVAVHAQDAGAAGWTLAASLDTAATPPVLKLDFDPDGSSVARTSAIIRRDYVLNV